MRTIDRLTPRQRQLLTLIARYGLSVKQAANMVEISPSTAKNHLSRAYRTIGVENMTQAFIKLGWLKVHE